MSTRSSQKQKLPNLMPTQKEFVNKYVHRNHPNNLPQSSPLDFSTLSEEELRKYRTRYLNPTHQLSPDIKTFQGFLLENSEIGERTESCIKNNAKREENSYDYRTRDDLRQNVEEHFKDHLNVKESEVIMNFVYKVRNEDKKFRVQFDRR